MTKVHIYVFQRNYMGDNWRFSRTVSWAEYQDMAKRIPGEGSAWRGVLA